MADITSGDGTRIHVEDIRTGDVGSGPPVVLVHGITESGETWRPITDRLAPNHRVVLVDLRGHGSSGSAERYDLEAMAGDVVAVAQELELDRPHLVGHSLGGVVVTAVGAELPVSSVVNVDQSLQLSSFKAQLTPVEAMLRDRDSFPVVIDGLFTQLAGTSLPAGEWQRIQALRRGDQQVVLGVWELMFTMSEAEIAGVVEGALAGYAGSTTPYLSLFGIDPGRDYEPWLAGFIPESRVEEWPDHGHYPHLVDPDRFVARLEEFWAQ